MCGYYRHAEPDIGKGGATVDRADGGALGFVSVGGEKGHPYFQCLKRNSRFSWTEECEAAFIKLKEYLATPPVLCKPVTGVPLRLYFTVTERAISSVLVQEQDQSQKPIYFVSKALQGAETRYQALEKAALAVVFSCLLYTSDAADE